MMQLRCTLLAVTVAACGGEGASPIRVGVISTLTGDLSVSGVNQREAVELAIHEINEGGGVLGRRLESQTIDDGTTTLGTSEAYEALHDANVPAILGPTYSAGVVAVTDQIRRGTTLTVSGSATSPALATLNDGGYFFRTVPSDAVQSIVLAKAIRDAMCERVCVVYRDDAYGRGLADALKSHLEPAVRVKPSPYDPNLTSFAHVLVPCDEVQSELGSGIVFITYTGDGRQILDAAASHRWSTETHQIFLVDANRRQELFSALQDVDPFVGAIGTAPSGPKASTSAGTRRQDFEMRFVARHGHPPATFAENLYDAVYVVAMAIEIAGSTGDRPAIRDAVAATTSGPAMAAGDWDGIRAAIAAYGQVDFEGASGEVTLDPTSGELLPPYYITLWTIDADGEIKDLDVVAVDEM